ncbi:MAG: peptidylprolyl isomerase [Pseudomonadota bacterium]
MLTRLFGATIIAAALALPVSAQENPVLATVNGKDITASDVAFAIPTLESALSRVPANQRPQVVLDLLIDMELIADAAEKAGVDEDPIVAQRLDYYRSQTLRDLYLERLFAEEVTEDAVRARYEEEAAKAEPTKQVTARHILVDEEELATQLIAELAAGGDFDALAKEHSKDPGSASRGGLLPAFGPGRMVPPFEEAAFALEAGETSSEPVKSDFGFHIIRVEESTTQPVPSFEQVGSQIRQLMIRQTFVAEINRLKETATIERTNAGQ